MTAMNLRGRTPNSMLIPWGFSSELSRGSVELRTRYAQTLIPLVYGSVPPTFENAFASFEAVAQELLAAC